MKKVLSTCMAILLSVCLAPPVLAADRVVPGQGVIGLDEGTDPDTLISISVPLTFKWTVTELTYPNITSASYTIENESSQAILGVTLRSFSQSNSVTIPGTLVLNLTGDLLESPIGSNIVGYTGTTAYSATLDPNSTWTFGFNGTYNSISGSVPTQALVPTYDMSLHFEVVGVSTTP